MAVRLGAWFAGGDGAAQGKAAFTGDVCTILVVDDESAFREVLSYCLETRGFRVLQAANGREALARLEDTLGEVSLVVTDIVMPAMDGLELAAELGREGSSIGVLTPVLGRQTAGASASNVEEVYRALGAHEAGLVAAWGTRYL